MKKIDRILLIIATSLVVLGSVLLGVALSNNNYNGEIIVNEYSFDKDISKLDINLKTSDLYLKKASDDKLKVICEEIKMYPNEVNIVDNNTLFINQSYTRNNFGIFQSPYRRINTRIDVYLPKNNYDDIKFVNATGDINFELNIETNNLDIELSTGEINLKNINVINNASIKSSTGKIKIKDLKIDNDLFLKSSTGDILAENTNCNNLTIISTTGEVDLNNSLVNNHLKINTTTGDIELYNFDANTINITTTTGSVEGNILSNKRFITSTRTGDIEVPKYSDGPLCEITTTTGDIEIEIGRK